MTHTRRWTRPLIATWPLLVALLAFATISHDVAMAAHTHETPIPAGVVEANIAHAFTGMHEGIPPEPTLLLHYSRGIVAFMPPLGDIPAWAKPIVAAVLRTSG